MLWEFRERLYCPLEGSRRGPDRDSCLSLILKDKEDFHRGRFLESHSIPRKEDERRVRTGNMFGDVVLYLSRCQQLQRGADKETGDWIITRKANSMTV